jgi:hypothetical protein
LKEDVAMPMPNQRRQRYENAQPLVDQIDKNMPVKTILENY